MTITDLTLARPGRRPTTKEVWVLDGLCRDRSPMWDSSAAPTDKLQAMRICHDCPVFDLCEQAGRDEVYGIWAGVDKAHPDRVPEDHPSTTRYNLKARAAMITAVEGVVKKDGSFPDAATATGKSVPNLRRALHRADRLDLIERLDENKPEPATKLAPRPLNLRQQRALEFINTVSRMARNGDSMDDVCAHFAKTSNSIRQRLTTHKRRDLIDTLLDNRTRQQRKAKKEAK